MLSVVACAPTSPTDEAVGEARQNALFENALFENALFENALFENALFENALFENALTTQTLTATPLFMAALEDPNAREVFKYIVSCALPEEQQITVNVSGVDYTFAGHGEGLAPEWGEDDGSCDADCRSWVSACVIARLDYLGQPVSISMRGDNDGLKSTKAERAAYPHIEATYYGDIFSEPKQIFACLPAGKTQIPRVCGPSLADCVVQNQGSCDNLCGNQKKDGSYPDCREAPTMKKNGGLKKGNKHVGSVTVFLQ